MIQLKNVYPKKGHPSKTTLELLYALLATRKPNQSISHKKMPDFDDHVAFVCNKPYKAWYLIKKDKATMGAIYLSPADEIGIFLFPDWHYMGFGKMALDHLYAMHREVGIFYANINPLNTASLAFFLNQQYKYQSYTAKKGRIIQFTYYLPNPYPVIGEKKGSSRDTSCDPETAPAK